MSSLFFDDFFSGKKKDKKKLLDNLYKVPIRDKGLNVPHFINNFGPNQVQQADILFMPADGDHKYILVVVDNGNKLTDAEPLKTKSADEVLTAFKKIYARGVLKLPKIISVDPGSEFKGSVANWFKEKKVEIRVGKVARHRQQALVERKNRTIATALFKRMSAQEILTEQPSTEWVEDLPPLLKALNKKTKATPAPKLPGIPVAEGDSQKLLKEGTRVRVALEQPEDVAQGKRLHGKFRATDIRWDPKIRTIKYVLVMPNFPPMYMLDGNFGSKKVEPIGYTKNQLQVVPKDEEYPSYELIRNPEKVTQFRVEKIVDSKKVRGKLQYKIRWAGYPPDQDTWEDAKKIKEDVPHIVEDWDSNQKGSGYTTSLFL